MNRSSTGGVWLGLNIFYWSVQKDQAWQNCCVSLLLLEFGLSLLCKGTINYRCSIALRIVFMILLYMSVIILYVYYLFHKNLPA